MGIKFAPQDERLLSANFVNAFSDAVAAILWGGGYAVADLAGGQGSPQIHADLIQAGQLDAGSIHLDVGSVSHAAIDIVSTGVRA